MSRSSKAALRAAAGDGKDSICSMMKAKGGINERVNCIEEREKGLSGGKEVKSSLTVYSPPNRRMHVFVLRP